MYKILLLLPAADFNDDGIVDILDIVQIVNYILDSN